MNGHDDVTMRARAVEETPDARAAHEEYLREAQQLIDEQTTALFEMIASAVQQEAPGARVQREERRLIVSDGGQTLEFIVEGITDLPEGTDRAQVFVAGQARCIVTTPDGATQEWILHRRGAGDAAPSYAWMPVGSDSALDEAAIASLVTSALHPS